jgi:hypothetical protein
VVTAGIGSLNHTQSSCHSVRTRRRAPSSGPRWRVRGASIESKFLGINGRSPLLCTLEGKPLHASYVRTLLHRLGAKAEIEKRVHPHALRHSMAFDLMWGKASWYPSSRHSSVTPHGPLRRGTSTTSLPRMWLTRSRGANSRCRSRHPNRRTCTNCVVRTVPLSSVGDGATGVDGWVWDPPLSARPTTRPPKDAPHPMTPNRRIRQGAVHGG